MRETIIITGGLGFIGSHLSEFLNTKNYEIVVIDNLSDGSCEKLIPYFEEKGIFIVQDSVENIFKHNLSCQHIIHLAAESNVDKSIHNPIAFMKNNIESTMAICHWAIEKKVKNFIYFNTDEVYGSSEDYKTKESKLNPSNPYAVSKASAGHYCWAMNNTFQMPVKEIRCCNVIGPRQAETKIIPKLIQCGINDKSFSVYDNGIAKREYIDIRDLCPIVHSILQSKESDIFNITFNQEYSIMEIIKEVENVLGKKIKTFSTSRLGHDKYYRMIPDKIISNHKMKHSVQSTITSFFESFDNLSSFDLTL